ncbi:glycosyltransferase 87 family protein [Streptomyces chartreusis]|uniref:glycosyltransferase 87 family protein n=1 Tax=Streptomyces chartreusis TaxID=1969 RepID=UPI0036B68A2A
MSDRKSDISGWLVRPASWHLWVVLAAVLGAVVARTARLTSDGGMDNAIVVRAARVWLAGGSPYDDPHFLYLPSAVVAAAPWAAVPRGVLSVLVPVLVAGCLVGGWVCALRLHGVALRSRFAALGLIGLAAGFAPFAHLVLLGNWTATAALALPLAVLLLGRGRWLAAGLVLGAAVALKPLLAPMGLLFVFARRWRGLAWPAGVPAAASAGAALLLPDPAGFLTRTLPFLLRGDDGFVRLYEASPLAVLPRVGVPAVWTALLAFGMALVPQVPGVTWPYLEAGERRAFRDAVTLCVLAVTLAAHCRRSAGRGNDVRHSAGPVRGLVAVVSGTGDYAGGGRQQGASRGNPF